MKAGEIAGNGKRARFGRAALLLGAALAGSACALEQAPSADEKTLPEHSGLDEAPEIAGIQQSMAQRCPAFSVELATCRQPWEQLPGGQASLDLGTGQLSNVEYKLLGVGNRVAHIQGDIVLGDESAVRGADGREAAVRISTGRLWPNGVIPFEIDGGLPSPERVHDAMAAWSNNSRLRFVPRTTETDFVRFVDGDGCSSAVGRTEGAQLVTLNAACSTANTIHEIGHAIGLWHEQSRTDRDRYIDIHWDNIEDGKALNFNMISGLTSADLVGYNFGSIMHYPTDAFAKDKSKPVITVKPGVTLAPGTVLGQRNGLSRGDIIAVNLLYCEVIPGRCVVPF